MSEGVREGVSESVRERVTTSSSFTRALIFPIFAVVWPPMHTCGVRLEQHNKHVLVTRVCVCVCVCVCVLLS